MPQHQQAIVCLQELEQVLRQYEYWQEDAPAPQQLASEIPFAADTLSVTQWLQWVLIPRLKPMLVQQASLPHGFEISPYIEEAMAGESGQQAVLAVTRRLDGLMAETN